MLRVLCIFIILASIYEVTGSYMYDHFCGGSISVSVQKVNGSGTEKLFADLDIITGWVFQKGPCGPNCSKSDINKSTRDRRLFVENATGNYVYFGNWSAEYKFAHVTRYDDLNTAIHSDLHEIVLAINTKARWEQELMKVSIELEASNVDDFEDIFFEGESWHPIHLQWPNLPWHIQAKIDKRVRNDTGQPNRSPFVFVKPMYRIKLNAVSTIHIAAADTDGDLVKCSRSVFSEAGKLSSVPLPGLTVNEDCSVTIDASAAKYGYYDDSWGAVAMTVRDYNTDIIQFVGERKAFTPFMYSLSGTAAQFLVQVLENLNAPEFVPPTADANHHFIIYSGTIWRQKIYAKSNENTTISEFTVMGRQQEILSTSRIQDGDEIRVKFIEITWIPKDSDVSIHIFCINAIDDTGADSDEDRCFTVEIRPERFNHSSTIALGRPYFIDLPEYQQPVGCKLNATCILPLFVASNITLKTIRITSTYFSSTAIGPVDMIKHEGKDVYKSDLSFRDSVDGIKKICLIAIDINGHESDETCIQSELLPTDPCESNPCKNSASCIRSEKDPAVYACRCLDDSFSGKNCEIRPTHCNPTPCKYGGTCYEVPPDSFYCDCTGTGFVGDVCSTVKDECTGDLCINHGVCDKGNCSCYERYNGPNCTNDKCPSALAGQIACGDPTCPSNHCNGHGMCNAGGACICSIGYNTDAHCNTVSGHAAISQGIAGIRFVPPSPTPASSITCYRNTVCTFDVFLATSDSKLPIVKIDRAADEIKTSRMSSPYEVQYIPGLDQLYTSKVVIPVVQTTSTMFAYPMFVCLLATSSFSSDRICLEIQYTQDPSEISISQEAHQKNAKYQFISPTPNGESKFVCHVKEKCALVLHTRMVNGACENVASANDDVYTMPTQTGTSNCTTEVIYRFPNNGTKRICFVASVKPSSQTRCFYIEVYSPAMDRCAANSCRNHGDCFYNGSTDVYCFCQPGYLGDYCEKGECSHSDTTCHPDAYCYQDDLVKQCICPMGMSGTTCRDRSADNVTKIEFTDTAVPVRVTCFVNRLCTIPVGVTTKDPLRSSLEFGYVSPRVRTQGIAIAQTVSALMATVFIIPLEVGRKIACVQTHYNKSNEDEICIDVDVTADFSTIYGFQDKPNFIAPSMPMNAEVRCRADEPCHVLYHVTPGIGHAKEWTPFTTATATPTLGIIIIDVIFTKMPFEHGHIFSSCSGCVPGFVNNNCSVDVSLILPTSIGNNNYEMCLAVILNRLNLRGEERCANISLLTNVQYENNGCRKLKCKNAGFCDSHVHPAVCFCPAGFTGSTCEIHLLGGFQSNNRSTFVGENAVPTTIQCSVNSSCSINFDIEGPPNLQPTVRIGYRDASLSVLQQPSSIQTGPGGFGYKGTTIVIPHTTGNLTMCLQSVLLNFVEDELCLAVNAIGKPAPNINQAMPYFVDPTPLDDSTVLCQTGTACHLQLYFPTGSMFSSVNLCPYVLDTSRTDDYSMHAFKPVVYQNTCIADIVYLAPNASQGQSKQVCFQIALPGKQGEERCFEMEITHNMYKSVISPCKGVSCEHNGTCIADPTRLPPDAECACQSGFVGKRCQTAIAHTNTTSVQNDQSYFDKYAAKPTLIACEVDTTCEIPVTYIGPALQPPVVGYIDSHLNGKEPITAFGNLTRHDSNDTSNLASMFVTSSVIGNHALCLHLTENKTTITTGHVTDQLCFTVEVLAAGSIPGRIDQRQPHFAGLSVLNGSSLSCMKGRPCGMWATTVPTDSGQCTNVEKCPPFFQDLTIFPPTLALGTCISEIDFTVSTDQARICISAGPGGEQRTYNIVTTNTSGAIVDLSHSSIYVGTSKPYIIETPELKGTLSCERGSTCTTPIYVRSMVPLSSIDITYNRNAPSTIAGKTLVNHNVEYLYTATLNVQLNTSGIYHICLVAKDMNNLRSDETCVKTEMVYQDPCQSLPCQNSGSCVRDLINREDYVCLCESNRYLGKNCETLRNPCQPSPCMHGTCHVVNSYASCQCDPGYIGEQCDHVSFNCHKTSCMHGVCQDFLFSSHCACYPGYIGQRCDTRSP